MGPISQLGEQWDEDYGSTSIQVDCLMPTGIIIMLNVKCDDSISEIKSVLWKEAQKYPLYSSLKDKNAYLFMCISQNGDKLELVDESKLLWEVKPFQPMLKVIEKLGNEAEKLLNEHIASLLGKGLNEFDNLKSEEVSDFRRNMREVCLQIAKERDSQDWLQRAMCRFPPNIGITNLQAHLPINTFDVIVYFHSSIYPINAQYIVLAQVGDFPDDVKQRVLDTHYQTTQQHLGNHDNYALKILGREEYLLGDFQLTQFKYVQRMLSNGDKPTLLLVSQESVLAGLPPMIPPKATERVPPPPTETLIRQHTASRLRTGISLWKFDSETFSLNVTSLTANPTVSQFDDYTRVNLRACLYHGPEPISEVVTCEEQLINQDGLVKINQTLEFDIAIKNIPRMARLCFVLSVLVDKRGGRERKHQQPGTGVRTRGAGGKPIAGLDVIPVAWVNIPVFDYKDRLRDGHCTLYMWNLVKEDVLSEEQLNPIGTVEDNPHSQEAVCMQLTFPSYSQPVYYPDFPQVLEEAATLARVPILDRNVESQRRHLQELENIMAKDPLTELHEQEKDLVWRLRNECQFYYPESLPRLLTCVHWNNHLDVAEMMALLQIWKPLPATAALELLDFAYADNSVRKYAVKCIRHLSDAELLQYLLQLVQVLKYESYLECDLVEFLLERCLNNQTLGHYMFWLLRSEMHVPSFGVRFGLILEAYCRGNINYMSDVFQQVQALEKFKFINKQCKIDVSRDVKKARATLKQIINQETNQKVLSNLKSTLDPAHRLHELKLEKCTVKDSKMRPLWLEWKNSDLNADEIRVMYKMGDDLKQDMLTLQILRIMDNIWLEEGLDLRLNAYGCLSTGDCEGLIEIVSDSNTIANIQKEQSHLKLKSGFNKKCLYAWLKKHHNSEESLNKATEEFLLSCAGYCVATYVLGVGDRHSDNILLKENGQLFHIDFGHFLGNFKSKYGFKRERVPFVLTSDYVYVIMRGPEQDNGAFERFRNTCLRAYMALRKQTNLLITLFMMMVNTGIPELSSLKNIDYLKLMLAPHLSEADAKAHFKNTFEEALKYSYFASMNNTFHNMAKDGK